MSRVAAGTDVIECRLVGSVVRSDGIGVEVPAPGQAVGTEQLRADGDAVVLEIEVSADGRLRSSSPTDSRPGRSLAVSRPACSDAAYSFLDVKERKAYRWFIGDGRMPSGLSRTEARRAFGESIGAITRSVNDCGYADQVSARHSFQGRTAREADISAAGNCTSRDRTSTWDAGNLGARTVAQTCFWTRASAGPVNELIEADVRFNVADHNFVHRPGARCSNRYDVRSVGAHEAGHLFGLGHVGAGHENLTMYVAATPCTTTARTLGRGEVIGLRDRY